MRDVTEEEFKEQLNTAMSYAHFGNTADVSAREAFLHQLWDHVKYLNPKQPIVVVSSIIVDWFHDVYGFVHVTHIGEGLPKIGILRPLTYFPQSGSRMHVYRSDSLDKVRALVFSDNTSQPIKLTLGL